MPVRSPAAPTPSSTSALIAFGNQMQKQMTMTGKSISSWFESARNAANTSINGVGK